MNKISCALKALYDKGLMVLFIDNGNLQNKVNPQLLIENVL